jgi:hypothetical protein
MSNCGKFQEVRGVCAPDFFASCLTTLTRATKALAVSVAFVQQFDQAGRTEGRKELFFSQAFSN